MNTIMGFVFAAMVMVPGTPPEMVLVGPWHSIEKCEQFIKLTAQQMVSFMAWTDHCFEYPVERNTNWQDKT